MCGSLESNANRASSWWRRGSGDWMETTLIDVVAFQKVVGDELAILEIMIESDIDTSRGEMTIRRKLVELQGKFLSVTVTVGSPEVGTACRLFVEVWDRKRRDDNWRDERIQCSIGDHPYFEGIADDVLKNYTKDDGYSYL